MSFSNPILWHRGQNLTGHSEPRKSSRGVYQTFFSWFSDHSNPGQDDVARVTLMSLPAGVHPQLSMCLHPRISLLLLMQTSFLLIRSFWESRSKQQCFKLPALDPIVHVLFSDPDA